jgi:hypothetical protein
VWERFRKTKPQAVKIGIEQDKSFNTLGNKKIQLLWYTIFRQPEK